MADDQVRDKEAAIVAAYLEGAKVADIERRFGVGRSTIYHFLRRNGGSPSRSPRVDAGAKDAALAGLYELIQLQDRRIEEQNAEQVALRATCKNLERRLRKLDGAGPASKHNAVG
jgi:transposase-like protein